MKLHSNTELSAKETARGKRIFISNALLSVKAKLQVGDKLKTVYDKQRKEIRMVKSEDGTISVTPSGKRLVIDLHNKSVAKVFGQAITRVTVFLFNGTLTLRPTHAAGRAYQRIMNAKQRMLNQEPLLVGEVCHGVGGLGLAIHSGFQKQGLGLKLAFANDIDEEAMSASMNNNPLWDEDSLALHCSLEQIPTNILPQTDILIAGLSCKGASKQARTGSNKKLTAPEFHTEAGWLALPFYHLIASEQVNPLAVVIENVPEYLDTASAEMLRQSMSRLGYRCFETVLSARDFGSLENRKRMAMVFLTVGIDFSFEDVKAFHKKQGVRLADIIDHTKHPNAPIDIQVPMKERQGWYLKSRLLERQQEAIDKGKGHRARIADPESNKVSTLTASYGKGVRLDEDVVESRCGNWLRLFTLEEHAAIKELPVTLLNGVSKTVGHRLLGNSVTSAPWVAVGEMIANSLKMWFEPQFMNAAA